MITTEQPAAADPAAEAIRRMIRALHCAQAAAGYFYCAGDPDDPCGPGPYPHDGHAGSCSHVRQP